MKLPGLMTSRVLETPRGQGMLGAQALTGSLLLLCTDEEATVSEMECTKTMLKLSVVEDYKFDLTSEPLINVAISGASNSREMITRIGSSRKTQKIEDGSV